MFSFQKYFQKRGLLIAHDEHKGHYIVANKNFKAGDTILTGYPFSYRINDENRDQRCHFCYKVCPSLKLCGKCRQVGYCSRECQIADWKNHKQECPILCEHKDISLDQDMFNVFKIVVNIINERNGDISNQEEIAKIDNEYIKGSYKDISLLCSHSDLFNEDEEIYRSKCKMLLSLFTEEQKSTFHLTEDFIFTIYLYLFTNHFEIMDDMDSSSIAIGFYPSLSLFNHSCAPNVYRYNHGNAMNIQAIRKIQKGEEICVNYTTLYSPTPIRKQNLQKFKHFDCMCPRCSIVNNPEDVRINKRKCISIKEEEGKEIRCGGVCEPVYIDNYTMPKEWKCEKCGDVHTEEEYKNKFEDSIQFLDKKEEAVDTIESIIKILKNFLTDTNYQIESYTMKYYSYLISIQAYEKAYDLGIYILHSLEGGARIEGYPKIAGMYANIGTLCCHLARYREAQRYLEKAKALYKNVYPSYHPRVVAVITGLQQAESHINTRSKRR
ncbi:hypothetical protein WA158_000907 [Blastocystis sp. Blastoise]